MTLSKTASSILTIAALLPAICNATPEKASAKACATAFAAKIAAPGKAAPGYLLDYRASTASALDDFYAPEYRFTLEARDPKTGAAIARAECSTNTHGTVTSISAVALEAKIAAR